jgi:hypothetical protein
MDLRSGGEAAGVRRWGQPWRRREGVGWESGRGGGRRLRGGGGSGIGFGDPFIQNKHNFIHPSVVWAETGQLHFSPTQLFSFSFFISLQ